jgi:sulfite exporter TauE/SafE
MGLVASLSSCLAIVGGLILSISAKAAQSEKVSITKDLSLFHLSRVLGFGLLGGILGLLGKTISINSALTAILGIIAALIMVILGFSLIGVIRSKITLPTNLFTPFKKFQHHHLAPIFLGVASFLLPCGFTQSMQISALNSGNFIAGFLIMFAFALGTLPVLCLLSFSSVSFAHSRYSDLFFKTIGIIVLGLGIFALISSLTGLGIINPLFNL